MLLQLGDPTTENGRWIVRGPLSYFGCLGVCFDAQIITPNRCVGGARDRKIASSASNDVRVSVKRVLLHQAVIDCISACRIFLSEAASCIDCCVACCPDIASALATHADISPASSGLVCAI